MTEAVVKSFFPADNHGYVHSPDGGPDILIRLDDRYKRQGRRFVPVTAQGTAKPRPGSKVHIVEMSNCKSRAVKWRLRQL